MTSRIVQVRQNILKKNDLLAAELHARFCAAGVFVVSLVSSPGSGKTALLERTLRTLAPTVRVAALVGDLATDRDAARLQGAGVPVRQITTGTVCHLDASMIDLALADWNLAALDVLFIENVGNLVCPASYALGEHLRVVLLSVTEGEDKPLKYPSIFNTADVAVITKTDLAGAVHFDRALAVSHLADVRPELEILELSAVTGDGMPHWIRRLESARRQAFPTSLVRTDSRSTRSDGVV